MRKKKVRRHVEGQPVQVKKKRKRRQHDARERELDPDKELTLTPEECKHLDGTA